MTSTDNLVPDLAVEELRGSVEAMRTCVREVAHRGDRLWTGPLPGLTEGLMEVARVDLCLARLVEGHADAMRILDQAGREPEPGVYGVWASRSAGTGVKADREGERWAVHGQLRFASGVDVIDRALLPVWPDPEHHVLLDIAANRVDADRASWHTTAMDASRSFTVRVDTTVAADAQVGPTDFYLDRPGFVIGGLGPAAVWLGGAQQVVDVVTTNLRSFETNPHQLRRVGLMEQSLWQARAAMNSVLRTIEAEQVPPTIEIAQARTAVVLACEQVLAEAPRVVGPAGVSSSARLARVLADLAVYIRQHHLDAELTRLGDKALFTHQVLGE